MAHNPIQGERDGPDNPELEAWLFQSHRSHVLISDTARRIRPRIRWRARSYKRVDAISVK